jgi:hypothetical protein
MLDGIGITTSLGLFNLHGNVTYESKYQMYPLGQKSYITLDGGFKTFNKGVTLLSGVVVLEGVSRVEGDYLKALIVSVLKFELNSFSLSSLSGVYDFGGGTSLTNVYYDKDSTEGVLDLQPPDVYKVSFPYKVKV